MKYIVSCAILLCLSINGVFGEYEKDYVATPEYYEVEEFEGEFAVELHDDGTTVTASWEAFDDESEFLWYKLLYSTTKSKPVYPDQAAVFVGTSVEETRNSFALKYGKNHYIRLCVVTQEEDDRKGRYCSDVEKITTSATIEAKSSYKKDYGEKYESKKDIYQEKNTDAKSYVKESTKKTVQKSNSPIADATKKRVETVLEKFITRLENNDFSDDQKLAAIDRVTSKLETLGEKKPRYKDLVDYMITELETYKSEIDDGVSEIEAIFEDL